ncbi:MAG: ornithine cyclodeaminase family protein [Pseudomonadota bacterium]
MNSGGLDFRTLSGRDLAALGLGTQEIVDAIADAVRQMAAGRLHAPPKTGVLPGDGRYVMTTLSVADPSLPVVAKLVSVQPANPAQGLPAINGAILVMDGQTGVLRAVMGANWITAARTAGMSALMAQHMADPAAEVIAFIGCGVQARAHLAAFAELFPLSRVLAFGRGAANTDALLAEARALGLTAEAAPTARAALEQAQIVISAVTRAPDLQPFLDAAWLAPGSFAAVTDVALPWLPETLGAIDRIIIDDLTQERVMKPPMLDLDLVWGDMADVVTGRRVATHQPDRRQAFIFRGQALADHALAALALARADGSAGK